jgi:hypothetical protein
MDLLKILKYLLNCFLLLIPVFIWNIIFTGSLPKGYAMEYFWKDIPTAIGVSEKILRIIIFCLPLIMSLSLETRLQKIGLIIYLIGLIIYFLSWVLQIYLPESFWSKSLLGFMAPAYTTIIWLVGIGLVGTKNFLKIPYFWVIYICLSAIFVIFHSTHAYIVFHR